MKTNLKILFTGVLIILIGVYLKLNKINVIDSILIITGIFLEAYAVLRIVKFWILSKKDAI
jgi:hypothetical membrane protein